MPGLQLHGHELLKKTRQSRAPPDTVAAAFYVVQVAACDQQVTGDNVTSGRNTQRQVTVLKGKTSFCPRL